MKNSKYWETEKGEVVKFGNSFMRCYEKAGKLQFGFMKTDGTLIVKNTIDRKELLGSKEGADYLLATIQEWREAYERGAYDDRVLYSDETANSYASAEKGPCCKR